MVQEPITLRSVISVHDYSALKNYYMYKGKPRRTKAVVLLLLISFGLLATSETAFSMPFFKPGGIIGMIIFAGCYFQIDREGRQLDRRAKFSINLTQELTLADDYVTVSWLGSNIRSTCSWETLTLAVEGDSHFFLFIEPTLPAILAKFELKEHQIRQIRHFIETRTSLVSDVSGWRYQL